MTKRFGSPVILIALAILLPCTLEAQHVGLSAGPAFPLSSFGEYRDAGFHVRGSLYTPGGRGRADIARVFVAGWRGETQSTGDEGDWRDTIVSVNYLPSIRQSDAWALRGLIGGSVHWPTMEGADGPGTVMGFRLGLFADRSWGVAGLTAEVALDVVLTDFGSIEAVPVTTVPILVGLKLGR